MIFYDHKAISLKGKEICMADYKGKVVLIVNTPEKLEPVIAALLEK